MRRERIKENNVNYIQIAFHLFFGAIFAVGLAIGCSPVGFEAIPPEACSDPNISCELKPGAVDYTQDYSVEEAAVDILVVNDSSGSMLPDQQKMGARFNHVLDKLSGLDWQIGITTMDLSNQYRDLSLDGGESKNVNSWDIAGKEHYYDYQDGRLIPMYGNSKVLSKHVDGAREIFLNKIQIPAEVRSNGDERGIFTASLAIENNKGSLLRDKSHLAVIFLTDEDVRGYGYDTNSFQKQFPTNRMREADYPEHFQNTVKRVYGSTKGVSIYPIIVKPNDTNCINQQGDGGRPGYVYRDLMNLYGGQMGSICDSDYSNLLSNIGTDIRKRVIENIPLACVPIQDDEHKIEILGTTYESFHMEGKNLVLKPALPFGARIQIKYSCTGN